MEPPLSTKPGAPRGRQFFFNPGPTNIPDRILRAMDRATIDFFSEEAVAMLGRVHAGLMRVLKTEQHLLIYASNGHGAWEAGLVNLFVPGDKLLVLESGRFSASWADMATALGYEVETITCDWRRGVPPEAVAERLARDKSHQIKGVLVVHNETATGVVQPLAAIRRAIDAEKHPAFFLVDTISSLASMDFRMDEWGVDIVVGGSQKGLMMTTGLAFTGISRRAMAHSATVKTRRSYWAWKEMLTHKPQRMPGTTPVHMIFGLEEALKVLEEEGLDAVFARHRRLANATRAAIAHWGGGDRNTISVDGRGFSGPIRTIEILPADLGRASDSVTAVMVPAGHDTNVLRKIALERFNLSLGGGLGPLAGHVFRIGHMGDLNEPMLLGALATIELSFRAAGIPHAAGGTEAAIRSLGSAEGAR
jgi:alanine-glyoxylate transaminase/serine-glyoxylate transaminase/serine-pyruvate transaminase